MNLKKYIALALLLCMVCALLPACSEDAQTSSLGAYVLPEELTTIKSGIVAQNDRLTLRWDRGSCGIFVIDKLSGETWGSVPFAYFRGEDKGNSYVQNGLQSSLIITFRDPVKNVEVEHNSFRHAEYITAANIENGVQLTYYFTAAEISVPVNYLLTNDGITATVDVKNIKENANQIVSVSVLPFFCSVKNDPESYLVVPSGSGALMMTDDDQREVRRYSEPVYGEDAAIQPVFQNTTQQAVRLPVFGASYDKAGMLGVITSAAEMASVNAIAGDPQYGHSGVYASFQLRGKSVAYIGNTWGGSSRVNQYSADVINVDPSVRYVLLDSENGDYSGIARTYRDYLLKNAGMKENVASPDLMLTFLGGAMTRQLFMGVPYKSMTAATTFDQTRQILADILDKTDATVAASLKGFGSTGLEHGQIAGGFRPHSAFGGTKGLSALSAWCAERGIDSFYDFELVFLSDSGKGFSVRNAAITPGLVRAKYYVHDIVTHQQTGEGAYLANRYDMATASAEITEKAKALGTTGVGLSSLTSIAYSDYNSRNYYCKAHMSDDVQRLVKAMNAAGLKTFGEAANAYAAVKLDYVFDTPTESSGFLTLDVDIPLYQMVFRGSLGISGGVINLSQDAKTEFLETVAFGGSLAFTLCAESDMDLLMNGHSAIGASVYEGLASTVEAYTKLAQPLLDAVGGSSITSFNRTGNLSETVFSNGVKLYVNYDTNPVETELGTLAPLSFIFS